MKNLISVLLLTFSSACAVAASETAQLETTAASCDWTQESGSDGTHSGQSCARVVNFHRIRASTTFDPFTDQEISDATLQEGIPGLTSHSQGPLIIGDDVYSLVKRGVYSQCPPGSNGFDQPCGEFGWNTQIWAEHLTRWDHGEPVDAWTFDSDWKPVPGILGRWEPLFQPVVVGPYIYVPGASGAVHKLDRETGLEVAKIELPDGHAGDPDTYIEGGLAAGPNGAIYYTAAALDPVDPFDNQPRETWMVKVATDDKVTLATYKSIAVGAVGERDACFYRFDFDPNAAPPWPPSPDAVPPVFGCGRLRATVNVTPAVNATMMVTVARSHFNPTYSYLVATDLDLRPLWTSDLRDKLNDGCGVLVPLDGTAFNDPHMHCRPGSRTGVNPETNQAPAGQANDLSSSSPVIAPDGTVLYGAYTPYNENRGHLFAFDGQGRFLAAYPFGFDITPTIIHGANNSRYGVAIADNLYNEQIWRITSLTAPTGGDFAINWQYQAGDDGRDWVQRNLVADADGAVYAVNGDGFVYKLASGMLLDKVRVGGVQNTASVPAALDAAGRFYTLSLGHLVVVGGVDVPSAPQFGAPEAATVSRSIPQARKLDDWTGLPGIVTKAGSP